MLYITYGRGIFESRVSGPVKVNPGNILVLFPGVWHRYRPSRSTGWDEFWVDIKGQVVDLLVEQGRLTPQSPVLDVGLNEDLLDQFQQCAELCELQPIGFRQLPLGARDEWPLRWWTPCRSGERSATPGWRGAYGRRVLSWPSTWTGHWTWSR